ncbi:glycosyltransferase family A protein [Streptomyces sp. NPDC097619]|uniref:glycosyltransferase family 2 protein n=1 Tax=Streptomyces sp. NPDC097619 TaxID=3157228 RepID=UPI00332A0AD5
MSTGWVRPADIKDVTVVVRVCNQAAVVDACLASLAAQTLGTERLEVIAVDDGSTDDSGALLARAAHQYPSWLRVGQVPRGLSPAAARNWGLSQAAGRYVMFLEGVDRLAPGALEAMVASGDRNESDVVLGKLESSGRHAVATSMFRRTQTHLDLYTSKAYWSLTPDKLFRTSMVQRRGLAFPNDMTIGDDQAFTAAAYIGADNISVVGDATCVIKGPGQGARVSLTERVGLVRRLLALVDSLVPPGPQRDKLYSRHLEVELGKATAAALLNPTDPVDREQTLWAASELLRAQASPGALTLLPRMIAVRFALLAAGKFAEAERIAAFEVDKERPAVRKTVENGRVYTQLPFFRDAAVGLPDELFDITDDMTVSHELQSMKWNGSLLLLDGYAFYEQLSTKERATRVVLRQRGTGVEETFSVTARRDDNLTNAKGNTRAMGRFSSRINLSQTSSGWPVPTGIWDLYLKVSFEGVVQEVRLGPKRSAELDTMARLPVGIAPSPTMQGMELVATPHYTPSGGLSIEVSQRIPLPVYEA